MIDRKTRGACLYINHGNGFKAPSEEISRALEENGCTMVTLDFFKEIGAAGNDRIWKSLWDFCLRHPRFLKANIKIQIRPVMDLVFFFYRATFERKVLRWLDAYQPDFIVATHFLTTFLIPPVLKRHRREIPVFGYDAEVVQAHPINLSPLITGYFVPTKEAGDRLTALGQPPQTIIGCDFPIDRKFLQEFPTVSETRNKLGLSDRFTLLLSFGGDGVGPVDLVRRAAEEKLDLQIAVITGRSDTTRKAMEQIKKEHPEADIRIFGFVDNMQEFLHACDMTAGKAGMNTSFESIYMNRPVIVTRAMENEEPVARYLSSNNYGWDSRDTEGQLAILKTILADRTILDEKAAAMKNCPVKFGSGNMAAEIIKRTSAEKVARLRRSKALYFDMAGTLCDIPIDSGNWDRINREGLIRCLDLLGWRERLSPEEWEERVNTFIEEKKRLRKVAKKNLREYSFHLQMNAFLHDSRDRYPLLRSDHLTHQTWEKMERAFTSTELEITVPFAGVVPLLEKLATRYDLYLLSNNVSRLLVLDIAAKIGCTHCFRNIFVSADCGWRKPDKRFLSHVNRVTGLKPSECVMIGDRLSQDIRMANIFGMKTVYAAMVDHEDNSGEEHEKYDMIIHDFAELEHLFEK
jgi:FMN phosphatase YigB (HAD superfamily)/UDP-N-acetylglucosamine:LPS N-acetylglucosamine transferase